MPHLALALVLVLPSAPCSLTGLVVLHLLAGRFNLLLHTIRRVHCRVTVDSRTLKSLETPASFGVFNDRIEFELLPTTHFVEVRCVMIAEDFCLRAFVRGATFHCS